MTDRSHKIGAIILAAGASTRLGQPKQLLPHQGSTLLGRTIDAIAPALEGPICIVTGHAHERIQAVATAHSEGKRVHIAYCPDWRDGMGSSLAFGVNWLLQQHSKMEAILVSVCDQPYLDFKVIVDLLQRHAEQPSRTIASAYDGTIGPPACFAQADFPALKQLRGDRGAKALLTDRAAPTASIPFPLGSIEVDTPEDHQSLLDAENHPSQL